MFQESEIINLALGIIAAGVFMGMYRETWMPRRRLVLAGFVFMLSASLFTVLEGLFWRNVFDFLEHISYGLAGISFGAAAWLAVGLQRRLERGGR